MSSNHISADLAVESRTEYAPSQSSSSQARRYKAMATSSVRGFSTPVSVPSAGTSRIPVPTSRSRATSSSFPGLSRSLSGNALASDTFRHDNDARLGKEHTHEDKGRKAGGRSMTRARSKSQMNMRRPDFSSSSNPVPALPSKIPISANWRTSTSPSKADRWETPPQALDFSFGRSESPPLPPPVEKLVKDELPPFQLHPGDRSRVGRATPGSTEYRDNDPDVYSSSGLSRSVGPGTDVRKRAATMRDLSSSLDDPPGLSTTPGWNGKARESGSSLRDGGEQVSGTNGRPPTKTNTPRSASMRTMASTPPSTSTHSRLGGAAAHLVPPENTYTPPKGTNWDEVVLPTVAKKLGLSATAAEGGEEGDLAIEWDRGGNPIKWAKRDLRSLRDANTRTSHKPVTPSSGIIKSFELSPDNPLRHHPSTSSLAKKPSRNSSRPTSVRPKTSADNVGLAMQPIRAVQGEPTDVNGPVPPEMAKHGPSRSTSFQRVDSNGKTDSWADQQAMSSPSRRPIGATERPRPARGSSLNLRNTGTRSSLARPDHELGSFSDQHLEQSELPRQGGTSRRQGQGEEVGKGCGCAIM